MAKVQPEAQIHQDDYIHDNPDLEGLLNELELAKQSVASAQKGVRQIEKRRDGFVEFNESFMVEHNGRVRIGGHLLTGEDDPGGKTRSPSVTEAKYRITVSRVATEGAGEAE